MLELNKVMMVGRLTRDPEMVYGNSGNAIAKMGVAVNRRGYGGREDETYFIDVTAFGQSAEFVSKYFTKGKAIYIEGRLQQDRWTDRETGGNRSKVYVIAERVQFAESKAEQQAADGYQQRGGGYQQSGHQDAAPANTAPSGGGGGGAQQPPDFSGGQTDDDLPF